jgi:hypothetical protein
MTQRRWWAALGLLQLLGCSSHEGGLPDHGPPPTLSGALLSFDSASAAADNAAQLPTGFTTPQQTVCGPDTTLGFLSELQANGITNDQVPYEWAPMVGGPDAAHRTIAQPEFFASGTVKVFERSDLDFRPTHPFGFDTTWDVTVDDPFRALVFNRPTDDQDTIHCELESGLYPDTLFSFTPTIGDRALIRGSWIFDCGHPAYEAEMHPPSFVALARPDGAATVSLAFANPFRVTQLFGAADLATDFTRPRRYEVDGVAPFTTALQSSILDAAITGVDHLEMHTLIEPTQFPPLTWFVCATGSKPSASATLSYSYQFVTRTGVTVTPALRGSSGCLELHAEMGATYQPWSPPLIDQPWPWMEISDEASMQLGSQIDVRQLIVNALAQQGFSPAPPAVQPDASPIIETFAPLAPHAHADQDTPTSIVTGADDQPFPFYGRVRVAWKL